MKKSTPFLMVACLFAGTLTTRAQVSTVTDDFNADYDYVASGVAGTKWDALVLNSGYVVSSADVEAEITAMNTTDSTDVLSFATISSYWAGDNDNGVALVKKVKADTDFDMKVKIVGGMPSYGYPAVAYMFAGLIARVDSKIADDSTGFVAVQAFDQYSAGFCLRTATGVGNRGAEEKWTGVDDNDEELTSALYPYLRLTKVGNVFTGYCSKDGSEWFQFSEGYERADMAGKVLQIGLFNATYNPVEGRVHFDDFSATGEFLTSSVEEISSNMNIKAYYANQEVVVNSQNAISNVSVYAVDGRLIAQNNNSGNELRVNVPAHSVYVVVVNTNEGTYSKKIAAF